MNSERRFDLDIMRAWHCNAVMLVHVFGLVIPFYGMRRLFVSTFFALAAAVFRINVPGFLFLAGYLALYGKKQLEAKRFLSSRLRGCLPLYLGFALFFCFYYYRYTGIANWIEYIFSGSAGYHLYFVPIIVQLYLLTPFLSQLVRRWPKATLYLTLAIGFGYSIINTLTYPLLTGFPWCLPWSVYYVYGLVAGFTAAGRSESSWSIPRLQLQIVGYVVAALLYEGQVHLAGYAGFLLFPKPWNSFLLSGLEFAKNLLGIACLRQIFLRLAPRLKPIGWMNKAVAFASAESFLVYLAHPLLLDALSQIAFFAARPWALFFVFLPLMWLCVWLFRCGQKGLQKAFISSG